ncbi:MAG TPA: aminotransferase class I/II-fold pyridoxal phosphate-dependent enzyme [Vicinamibacteria bacterium]|nr:aminotransferase class I/II-fold pyridoxal phosphate-dependent enzyme [Vicinamibacteria bacterium]
MKGTAGSPRAARDESFRAYYDASQLRTDTWNELKQLTSRRERSERRGKDTRPLQEEITRTLKVLSEIEAYFSFPGTRAVNQLASLLKRGLFVAQARQTERVVRLLVGDSYRRRDVSEIFHEDFDTMDASGAEIVEHIGASGSRPYCEVLVVDEVVGGGTPDHQDVRKRMLGMRRDQDEFVYDVVVVGSFEDAVIATLFNHNIQSVVIRYSFPFESATTLPAIRDYLALVDVEALGDKLEIMPSRALGETLKALRPELDLFLVTDDPLRNVAGHTGRAFRRVFYQQEDYLELHLSILKGIDDRYETPFFNALREYSHRPTGVFHALPISRGNSISKSHWIRDMGEFYGENIFLAETSATTGGLDSLLQPHGPIKRAQEKAARAFGAKSSYFVTNGTSTANKIVVQALMAPNEIALVSRDCHKSHHYAIVLAGSLPVYLDPYPVQPYSMYGAVPLFEIKRQLLALKEEGKLDRVRLLLLTNCTFDGIVYDPFRVMKEVLAVKPDMIFIWDEAWFGFARFSPTYRARTAMAAARRLKHMLQSREYGEAHRRARSKGEADGMPDPECARVRVYATQSTHKTLTSLRQGSMIHVYDQDFGTLAHEAFEEAYMTHTSTSPNYQILASLDVGRRQVELEGFELVEQSVSLAMTLRERIQESPLLSRYFQVLKVRDLVPADHRPSGFEEFYGPEAGYRAMGDAWQGDEFTLDPTRVTVHIGKTGMDGDTLRKHLMDRYDIQINKTSRNTLLFMLNIGTTRGAVAYLLEVLTQIAREIEERAEQESSLEKELDREKVRALTERLPPLPNFSRFHDRFRTAAGSKTPEGDLRAAFFLGRNDQACDFLRLDGSVQREMEAGREVVSAGFVTPYPPGFPVLVPGQILSHEILAYLLALDVKEIHGYTPEFGLRVFKQEVLGDVKP